MLDEYEPAKPDTVNSFRDERRTLSLKRPGSYTPKPCMHHYTPAVAHAEPRESRMSEAEFLASLARFNRLDDGDQLERAREVAHYYGMPEALTHYGYGHDHDAEPIEDAIELEEALETRAHERFKGDDYIAAKAADDAWEQSSDIEKAMAVAVRRAQLNDLHTNAAQGRAGFSEIEIGSSLALDDLIHAAWMELHRRRIMRQRPTKDPAKCRTDKAKATAENTIRAARDIDAKRAQALAAAIGYAVAGARKEWNRRHPRDIARSVGVKYETMLAVIAIAKDEIERLGIAAALRFGSETKTGTYNEGVGIDNLVLADHLSSTHADDAGVTPSSHRLDEARKAEVKNGNP